jgi:hypothetical protein
MGSTEPLGDPRQGPKRPQKRARPTGLVLILSVISGARCFFRPDVRLGNFGNGNTMYQEMWVRLYDCSVMQRRSHSTNEKCWT